MSKEAFLELKCNISSQTNYMMQGLSEVRLLPPLAVPSTNAR